LYCALVLRDAPLPSNVTRRFFRKLPRRTLQGVGALLVLGVVAFFGLTRTEVGRAQLARQIEAQFDARFAGALEIGRLTGNLVGTVYARDVRVRSPDGQVVLSVDSVRAAPRWRSLLGRRVVFREIRLIEPRADLVRSAGPDRAGSWNATRAFQTAPRDTTSGNAFALHFADVVVQGGQVRTQNRGASPPAIRRGQLFDYTDARLADVDARLSFARTTENQLRVDVQRLNGRLAGPGLSLDDARGQLTVEDGRVALGPLRLRLGQTRLRGTFAVDRTGGGGLPALDVDLEKSRLDHDEIRRLVPHWPLRGTTAAALQAQGPLGNLTVDSLRVARGESVLRAAGTVRGLPERLVFDVRFGESRLTAADLRAVLPALPRRQTARLARLGTARFSLEAEGRLDGLSADADRRLARASAQFDLETARAGALHGTAEVARSGRSAPLTYAAEVEANDFAAGHLTGEGALPTRLTGTLTLDGEGATAEALAGHLEAQLERSTVAGRSLDGLDATVRATGEDRVEGTATLHQRGGALRIEGAVDRSGAQPAYDLTARAERLDLGPLLETDSLHTALTGTARLDGRGTSLAALAGELRLALDSSTVTRSGGPRRTLPPVASTLVLAPPGTAGPRLALRGDVADLTLTGEAAPVALRALGRLWGRAFADALREAYHKPYRPGAAAAEAAAAPPASTPDAQPDARATARRVLAAAGLGETAAFDATLTLKRPAVLKALVPALPTLRDSLTLAARVEAGAETFAAAGTLRADRVRTGGLRAAEASGQFRASASLDEPLLESLRASFDAEADTLAVGGAGFRGPMLAASFRDEQGEVQLSTRTAGNPSGHLQLEAGLRLLPDRNRLRVRTVRLAAGDYRWQRADPGPVDLYADAVAVRGLTLTSRDSPSGRPQRMTLRGTLSAAPQDTLFANAANVQLGTVSRTLGFERRLGGRLGAQVALTGGRDTPELTGRLDARRLSIGDDLIGRLTARSRYVRGSEQVAFDAQIRPGAPPADSSALRRQENRLSASGTFALPGQRSEAGRAGALDLSLDVERADLFFLNHLFSNKIAGADGVLSGGGRIGGTFRDPTFQTDFQVSNGSFRIPRFGLRYGASGPVSVDKEGIKLDGMRLTGPDGGSARLGGALLFNDYDYFSFDLRAALDELRVIDVESAPALPFFGRVAGSGQLRLTGPLSDASLTAPGGVRTTPESELVIPIEEENATTSESGFLIFADSTGRLPDLQNVTQREGIFDDRPEGGRKFVDGLDLDLGIAAPSGSTVRLVFDPLLGDEIEAVGGGDIQVLREEGDFSLFGTFDVTGGSYLFTAGQVFQRRFQIEGGTLRWDGSAANARLDLTATYRTRASRAGLPGAGEDPRGRRLPIVVRLDVGGRVGQPSVDLSLAVDEKERGFSDYSTTGLETVLNREDSGDEYATSVLLTNTFLLTTDLASRSGTSGPGFSETGNRLAFNSVSQLVSSQLNRYLDAALPNLDVNLGVQGENPQDLDVVYGAALRLLDERLIIRGEGILESEKDQRQAEGFQGEFVVEVRLTPRVSAEAFYRREGSLLSNRALTSATGAGLSYQTEYATWKELWHRLFGWLGAEDPGRNAPPPEEDAVAAE
jgi:hypothetical protein